ncbi:unnamed protein product [Amoebophrya sp. A25]|nr:unnamed protein product [Amoebophrya sp. A25]|eukprot:GSA25T00024274001.1
MPQKEVVVEQRGGRPRAVWRFYSEQDAVTGSEAPSGDEQERKLKEDAFDATIALQQQEPRDDFKYTEQDFPVAINDPGTNEDKVDPQTRVGYALSTYRSPDERNDIIDRRVDILYNDHKVRTARREALKREKEKLDEERYLEQKNYLLKQKSRREMTDEEFGSYWKERMHEWKDTMAVRAKLKEKKDEIQEREELAECTFKPDTSTSLKWTQKRQQSIQKHKTSLLRIARLQRDQLQQLEQLHSLEASIEYNLKLECEKKLEQASAENPVLVDRFLATEKGAQLLENRTAAYLAANSEVVEDSIIAASSSITRERAESEAVRDILDKSLENIRERVIDDFRARRIHQRRAVSIRKLHAVVELQRIENEYRELATHLKGDRKLVLAAMRLIEEEYEAAFGGQTASASSVTPTSTGTTPTTVKSASASFAPGNRGRQKEPLRGWGRKMLSDPVKEASLPSTSKGTSEGPQGKEKASPLTSSAAGGLMLSTAASSASQGSNPGSGPASSASQKAEELRKRASGMFFQTDLVTRLKQEPWFLVAKHAAETEVAATRNKLHVAMQLGGDESGSGSVC